MKKHEKTWKPQIFMMSQNKKTMRFVHDNQAKNEQT